MGELSIRIKIGDREYPMKVSAAEEEKVRRAGKLINEKMREYTARFGLHDKQDLLAMVAFDCIVERFETESKTGTVDESISNKLDHLNSLLNQVL
ncbi:cell division protein ZapA [Cesiribacter sp. SM1]|uniref:cell division protein ZapA n=1 Tax=Cesiribacter sp. SM1 TaxID=2861196 RepID=UPI001CD3E86F|nr:cell division protein ZapA [Cesiribacter sp. SM1]